MITGYIFFMKRGFLKNKLNYTHKFSSGEKMLISAERAYMQNTFIALKFPLTNF